MLRAFYIEDIEKNIIIEGVHFSNNRVVVCWTNQMSCFVIWQTMEEFLSVSLVNGRRIHYVS